MLDTLEAGNDPELGLPITQAGKSCVIYRRGQDCVHDMLYLVGYIESKCDQCVVAMWVLSPDFIRFFRVPS